LAGPPHIRVAVESCTRDGGGWLVRFLLVNAGALAVPVTSAWIPHGRFRGAEDRLPLELVVPSSGSGSLWLRVHADEPPGTVVENAFLILTTPDHRIFTRMRIEFTPDPTPIVEATTFQPLT
jgi:hypothetical protein